MDMGGASPSPANYLCRARWVALGFQPISNFVLPLSAVPLSATPPILAVPASIVSTCSV